MLNLPAAGAVAQGPLGRILRPNQAIAAEAQILAPVPMELGTRPALQA